MLILAAMFNLEDAVGDIVKVQLKSTHINKYKIGLLYLVDRLGKYIMLIMASKRNGLSSYVDSCNASIVYLHAIEKLHVLQKRKNINIMQNSENIKNPVTKNNKNQGRNFSIEIIRKQEVLVESLSNRQLGPVLNKENGVISILADAAQVFPPYSIDSCRAINPMILIRLKNLVSSTIIDKDYYVISPDNNSNISNVNNNYYQGDDGKKKKMENNTAILRSDNKNNNNVKKNTTLIIHNKNIGNTRDEGFTKKLLHYSVGVFVTDDDNANIKIKQNSFTAFKLFLDNDVVRKWRYNIDNIVEHHFIDFLNKKKIDAINREHGKTYDKNENIKHMIPIMGFLHGYIYNSNNNNNHNDDDKTKSRTTYCIEKLTILNEDKCDNVSIQSIEKYLLNYLTHRQKAPSIIGHFVANLGFGTSLPKLLDTTILPSKNDGCFMVIDLIKSSESNGLCYKLFYL